jgi:purine nucleoside permease
MAWDRVVRGVAFILLTAHAGCTAIEQGGAKPAAVRQVKLLIITMFQAEADVWLKPLALDQETSVPGLSPDYPTVKCSAQDVCLMTTGMGHSNAAASVAALIFSRQFDLSQTYFLIAGIAGIDPKVGTIGSVAWARYLVDYGIAHEIDAREMPKRWPYGYYGIDANGPKAKPELAYRTEVFRLDEDLLQWAVALSRDVVLDDNDKARAYRRHYSGPGRRPPTPLQCDTATGDTYWHGRHLGDRAEQWVKLLTDGQGTYCTTQQEDNATYEALKRGAGAGLLDTRRVAVLRSGANFDRPYKGQTAFASLNAASGGYDAARNNLVLAGMPLVQEILTHWEIWRTGIPRR